MIYSETATFYNELLEVEFSFIVLQIHTVRFNWKRFVVFDVDELSWYLCNALTLKTLPISWLKLYPQTQNFISLFFS